MAITKIGGRQIDVDKSPLSSSNRDDSVLKDADGGLILTGNVRLLHAPSDDLDAATKAYVDATTGASVSAGFIAFGDSDGSGLEGSGDLMYYESGRAFGGSSTPVLALSGAVALGGSAGAPGLLLNYGGTVASGSVSVAGTLVLSSSRGEISFKDQGVEFLGIEETNSGDVVLSSSVSNKDMIFKVNDGGAATEVFRLDGDVSALKVATSKEIQFGDSGEAISGDDTDLTIKSGAKINLNATSDVHLPNSVGIVFGDAAEKIEGDGTNLTIAGNILMLSASNDVALPKNVGLTFDNNEKIESDGTDLTITVGTDGDINIGSDIGLTFGADGEKIEGDGSKMTINAANLDLTMEAGGDVTLAANTGLIFGDATEKIEGNADDITVNSSRHIILSGTSQVQVPQGVALTFKKGTSDQISADANGITATSPLLNLVGTGQLNIGAGDDGNAVLQVTDNSVSLAGSGDAFVIPNGASISGQAGSSISMDLGSSLASEGAVNHGNATGFIIPNYVHNSFEYLSATQSGLGASFSKVDGSSNVNVRHANDATSFHAGSSTRFVISGSSTNSSFVTASVSAYLNGLRLTPCITESQTADFAVTASSDGTDGKPVLHVNLDPSLNLQSGDKVILDFRMRTNG